MAGMIKVYWDSCAWIGLLNGEPDKRSALSELYDRARKGKLEIWTSTFTLVEVYRTADESKEPKPLDPLNLRKIEEMYNQPFVKLIQLDREIAELARLLVRTTSGLKKHQDAIHLASAIVWDVETMHTYDRQDLLHLSESLECKGGTRLQICYLDQSISGPLFPPNCA